MELAVLHDVWAASGVKKSPVSTTVTSILGGFSKPCSWGRNKLNLGQFEAPSPRRTLPTPQTLRNSTEVESL